jgi:hypothetical protein
MYKQDIEFDVFTTAIEGGINYWANVLEYENHTEWARPGGELVGDGHWYANILDLGRLDERDQEVALVEHDWVRVDGEVMRKGMTVLAGETDESREANRIDPGSLHAKLSFALATVVASGFTMYGDFEDMLVNDGCTGIAVLNPSCQWKCSSMSTRSSRCTGRNYVSSSRYSI